MSVKYHKYDIATKMSLVEEYLKLSKESKIAKSDFAYNKGISDSTFNDWVVKYLKDKDRFINNDNSNQDISIASYTKPTFIELTKDNITNTVVNNSNEGNIKLTYKDLTLELTILARN